MGLSRNDPCPCGSGKKYKSCCLAANPAPATTQALLQQALAQLQAGRWVQAAALCQAVLQQLPGQPDALHMLGLVDLQQGQPESAVARLAGALAASPQPSAQLFLHHGIALQGLGRLAEALNRYDQALALQPTLTEALNNRGRALHALGRLDEAATSYRKALALQPELALVQFSLGRVLQQQNQREEARQAYRLALQYQPAMAEARFNLGDLWRHDGHLDKAEACYREALALQPDLTLARHRLGLVLQELGQLAEAGTVYEAILRQQPNDADAWNNYGVLLQRQRQLESAEAAYRRALRLQPDHVDAEINLGDVLRSLSRPREAEASYRRALAHRPESAQALCALGTALLEQDRCEEAAAFLDMAIRLRPAWHAPHMQLGWVRVRQGLIDTGLASYRRAQELNPDDLELRSAIFVPLQYSHTPPAVIVADLRDYADRLEAPWRGQWPRHSNDRCPGRRLKIGYVSPDFRDHAVAYFIEPVLRYHDHTQVEVYCYYNHALHDQVTARLQGLASHWRPCHRLDDLELATLIQADGIDILVDLAGHTGHNRLPVFARKPAPIQVSWLGYLGSTGLQAMDYRLTDAVLDPPGTTESLHSETLWRLPAWAVFQPAVPCPPVNQLPALQAGHLTLACLNNLAKINADVVGLWAQILHALPGSRLLLGNARDVAVRARLLASFAEAGIAADRLELLPGMALEEFLALHHLIDLALDPFPFNGGATTGHSLWMGVPVVTLSGDSTVSRQGAAILRALDLPELVACSQEDYVAKAIALASDLPRLQALRQTLRGRMVPDQRAPLFARQLEQAYRDMWTQWCASTRNPGE